MCDICKELVACPVGEKRKIVIENPGLGPVIYAPKHKFTDAYGKVCYIEGPLLIIDKYPDHTNCFIATPVYDENNVSYGSGVDNIRFCPFCGERLVKENVE